MGALSRDDKTLYLAVRPNTKPTGGDPTLRWTGIVGVDLATGAKRQVATFPEPCSVTPSSH